VSGRRRNKSVQWEGRLGTAEAEAQRVDDVQRTHVGTMLESSFS